MYNKQIIILHKNSYLLSNMLSSFINLVNFFKGLTFESVKKFFVTFGLYLWGILKEVWNDVKTNNGNSIMFIAWFLISILCGFTFSILAMIVQSCYVHHMQVETCDVCNHKDMLKYTLVICIGSLLHCIF